MTPSDERALEAFAQHLQHSGLGARTVSAYVSDLRRYGSLPLLLAEHRMRVEVIHKSGLAARTRARHLAAHSRYYAYLAESVKPSLPLLPPDSNPYRHPPKMGVLVPACVPSLDRVRSLLDAEPSPMYRAIFALMAGAGLRVSEVLSLAWADFDSSKVLRVTGKGDKTRDVPLNDEVMRYVYAAYIHHTADHRKTDIGPAFPVTARSVQRRIKRYGKDLHPHALRHAFATRVYEGTSDLKLVGDLLGHSSVTTTSIYTHIADGRRSSAVALAL